MGGKIQRGFRLPTMLACNFTVPNTNSFNPENRNFGSNYSEFIAEFFL
jgi:hypothetical protein